MSTERTQTRWVGWIGFAGTIIILSGFFSATQGVVAILGRDAYFRVDESGELFLFNANGWGWWNLIVGLLLIFAGLSLYVGATWARVVAVILAALSAIGQLFLIPAQPWWAFIVIAVDILVIYAVTAHGSEVRED
ncbi:MAG: hypothetical protein ABWY36_07795 [Leifsonia sp.]